MCKYTMHKTGSTVITNTVMSYDRGARGPLKPRSRASWSASALGEARGEGASNNSSAMESFTLWTGTQSPQSPLTHCTALTDRSSSNLIDLHSHCTGALCRMDRTEPTTLGCCCWSIWGHLELVVEFVGIGWARPYCDRIDRIASSNHTTLV